MQDELLKPIFIGGTGRCGTTILKKVLQQDSSILAIPNELRIVIDPDGILDLVDALSERWSVNRADVAIRRFERLISNCLRETFLPRILRRLQQYKLWPLTIQGYSRILSGFGDDYVRSRTAMLMAELIAYRSSAQMIQTPPYQLRPGVYESGPFEKEALGALLRSYLDDLYRNLPGNKGAAYWLDDTPFNILHAEELAGLFKDMRLIHIYRDPRDVVASYIGKSWSGDDWEQVAIRVAGIYKQWHWIRAKLSSQQFIEISLEDLSANPERRLREVCDYIGIDFEKGFLSIKLDKTNSGRWKQEVPPAALDVVQRHLAPFLDEYRSNL